MTATINATDALHPFEETLTQQEADEAKEAEYLSLIER